MTNYILYLHKLNILILDLTGVLPKCDMKCDSEPCKNGGICTENFTNQESSCDCELTSYFGENCIDEKGADFTGESILQRKFNLSGPVHKVSMFLYAVLASSSSILILIQISFTYLQNDAIYFFDCVLFLLSALY